MKLCRLCCSLFVDLIIDVGAIGVDVAVVATAGFAGASYVHLGVVVLLLTMCWLVI